MKAMKNYETLEVCGQSREEFMAWCHRANDSFADFPMRCLIKNSASVISRPTFWCLEQTVVDMTHRCARIQEEHANARTHARTDGWILSKPPISFPSAWSGDAIGRRRGFPVSRLDFATRPGPGGEVRLGWRELFFQGLPTLRAIVIVGKR